MNKQAIEFTFNWIFSIVVGAIVIFLAIYAAVSFINTERTLQDTQNVQDLETLLNPLQTSIEAISKPSSIKFPREVRINSRCSIDSDLGEESLTLQTKNSLGGSWSSISFPNKISSYLFTSSSIQGTSFNALVVPFAMPYKVADLVILWTEDYCFVNTPLDIFREIEILNGTIQFTNSKTRCKANSKTVCFINSEIDTNEGCDLSVNTFLKQVRNQNKPVYYEDKLIYASIFSDPDIYECNLQRLTARAKSLAKIYSKKAEILGASQDCGSSLAPILSNYANSLNLQSSKDLSSLFSLSNQLNKDQGDLLCPMW